MRVEFLQKFNRDIERVQITSVKIALRNIIEKAEAARTLNEIPNLKKLKGFRNAFRIRIGEYRLGIFIEKSTITFVRLVHRKDIYKVFP